MAIQTPDNNALFDNTKITFGVDFGLLLRDADDTLGMLAPSTGSPYWNGSSWTWVTSLPTSGSAGGDLSGSYPNPTIANNAITFARMQDIASATILGRSTVGTGDPEALTAAQVRTLLALGTAALLNTGTVNGTIPLIGADNVLPASVIPPLRSHEFIQVADQAARLALTAAQVQPGDEAFQQDDLGTYKLIAADPSSAGSWVKISDLSIDAGAIVSGIVSSARLGTGTANSSTVLFGDGQYRSLPPSRLPVTVVTGATQQMAIENAYYANNTSQVVLTLPVTAAVGDRIHVRGIGSGGWRVAQNASQSIRYLDLVTVAGTTGWIETLSTPNSARACIEIECVVANTGWQVINGIGAVEVKES